VVSVDVPARRVTVGNAAAVMTSALTLAGPSVTWVDRPLVDGDRAVAQVSAHGRPAPCSVATTPAGWRIHFDDPQRLVAPGQTVALYDAAEPDAVVGAGIAA
jgi:tRNA-specific 2-thiouridylase